MLITDHLKDRNATDHSRPARSTGAAGADRGRSVRRPRRAAAAVEGRGFPARHSLVSRRRALAAVEAREFDVALIDLNYARIRHPARKGLNLLSRIQGLDPTLPVVVMTAWGSVEVAVEAMRRRARDFIQKPWDNARLLSIVRTQIELSQALRKGQRLERPRIRCCAAKACRTSWPNRRPCRTCCR